MVGEVQRFWGGQPCWEMALFEGFPHNWWGLLEHVDGVFEGARDWSPAFVCKDQVWSITWVEDEVFLWGMSWSEGLERWGCFGVVNEIHGLEEGVGCSQGGGRCPLGVGVICVPMGEMVGVWRLWKWGRWLCWGRVRLEGIGGEWPC